MALIATRPLAIQGRIYRSGEPVDPAALTSEKAAQLMACRFLRESAPEGFLGTYVACRAFGIGGHAFQIGDPVPVALFAPGKLGQLLEHRYLEPALPIAAPAQPVPATDRRRGRGA